jgi:WG containing repeat
MKKIFAGLFLLLPLSIFAQAVFPIVINKKWGYMDLRGKTVINPQFDMAGGFSNGLAFVVKGNKLGYIDTKGTMVIAPKFDACTPFSGGLAMAQREITGPISIINKKGRILGNTPSSDFTEASEGLIRQKNMDNLFAKWGYTDSTGKFVIQPVYDKAAAFSEGLALVSKDGDHYGYINKKGEMVIPALYQYPVIDKVNDVEQFSGGKFSEGLACVSNGDKKGFINAKGEQVIDFIFTDAGLFKEGLAPAKKDSLYGFINTRGEWVVPPKYPLAVSFSEGLAAVMVGESIFDGKWGFIDKAGKLVIPATFLGAASFTEDLAFRNGLSQLYIKEGVWGYINKKGAVVWVRK